MDYPSAIGNKKGFTLIEMVVVIGVMAILGAVAVPSFLAWLPDSRLKAAARDLYSNMQKAKMDAIRSNSNYRLVFDQGAGRYQLQDNGGAVKKIVTLADYHNGVDYGFGHATGNATVGGGPLPGSPITYVDSDATFNSRGTGEAGYVYLSNSKNTAYAIGTRSSGSVVLRKWDGANWK
ncbi:MAG: pilus assembly FimT family protein [Desulfatiglandales bacterium]